MSGLLPSMQCVALCVALVAPAWPGLAGASPPKRTSALALAKRAEALYREERYPEAVALLERAYDLYPEPVLLYDLGKAHERAGARDAAIASFRRYLEIAPALAGTRANAARRLEALEAGARDAAIATAAPGAVVATPAPAPATVPMVAAAPVAPRDDLVLEQASLRAAPAQTARPPHRRWWIWTVVGGVAVAGLAVGLGVGLTREPAAFSTTLDVIKHP